MLKETDYAAIRDKLSGIKIGHGIGTESSPCTVAAINLALSGRLTDEIPKCMSPVIGRWIISIQDAMPLDRLNGDRWMSLIPAAAGTGREREAERLAIILDWLWGTVLPTIQPLADQHGFGTEWRTMCAERTQKAAVAAVAVAAEAAAEAAAWAARAAAWAAWAAAEAAAWAAAEAAEAAARAAAEAAEAAARAAAEAALWDRVDPEGLLERLIAA